MKKVIVGLVAVGAVAGLRVAWRISQNRGRVRQMFAHCRQMAAECRQMATQVS